MKNKLFAIIMSIALVFGLVACGGDANETSTGETTVTETEQSGTDTAAKTEDTTTSVSDKAETSGTSIIDPAITYGDLIEVYSSVLEDAFNIAYIGTEPIHDGLTCMQGEVRYMEEESRDSVGFTFKDINDDGTYELILGCIACSSNLYGLFTYDNSGVKLLGFGGDRTVLSIYEQGYFVCEGSSGASEYSYNIYKLEGTNAVLQDFYFTDFKNTETWELGYFHNKTGEWDIASSEELTEQAFAVCSEIGLEQIEFNDDFIPLKNLSKMFGGTQRGITVEQVTGEMTWMLDSYKIDSKLYSAETNDVLQYMVLYDNGEAEFFRNEKGNLVLESGSVEYNYDEDGKTINFYFVDNRDGSGVGIVLFRFEEDGKLMTQRSYYDNTGYHVINEYYVMSVG